MHIKKVDSLSLKRQIYQVKDCSSLKAVVLRVHRSPPVMRKLYKALAFWLVAQGIKV